MLQLQYAGHRAGFQHIAGMSELATFGISNLDWERSHPEEPQFSDDSIAALRSATGLKSLNLGFGTRISDDGLKQLSESNSNLEKLSIRGPQITDAGMTHLAKMKNLKTLSI